MENLKSNERVASPAPELRTGEVSVHEMVRHVCSRCNWCNGELWNLGDFGKPRWVCQGCAKRALEENTKLKLLLSKSDLLLFGFGLGSNSPHRLAIKAILSNDQGEKSPAQKI